jgi:hypothetical protein
LRITFSADNLGVAAPAWLQSLTGVEHTLIATCL